MLPDLRVHRAPLESKAPPDPKEQQVLKVMLGPKGQRDPKEQ